MLLHSEEDFSYLSFGLTPFFFVSIIYYKSGVLSTGFVRFYPICFQQIGWSPFGKSSQEKGILRREAAAEGGKTGKGEPFWFPPGRFVSGNVHHLLDGHGVENGMGCRLAAVGFVDAFHDGVALALAGGHDDQQFAVRRRTWGPPKESCSSLRRMWLRITVPPRAPAALAVAITASV